MYIYLINLWPKRGINNKFGPKKYISYEIHVHIKRVIENLSVKFYCSLFCCTDKKITKIASCRKKKEKVERNTLHTYTIKNSNGGGTSVWERDGISSRGRKKNRIVGIRRVGDTKKKNRIEGMTAHAWEQ